jgi:hypothetical protein
MNCWGFTPALFAALDTQLREFLERVGASATNPAQNTDRPAALDPTKAEFYLPAAVSTMITRKDAEVTVLPTENAWFGVTYREDKPRVSAAIAELVRIGKYPAKLF